MNTTTASILLGGLIAGTLDIGAASLINLLSPVFILHVVAAGLLGRETSFGGGLSTAAFGMLLQWTMSLIIAAIFVSVAALLPILKRWWIAAGLSYGVAIFFVMNYVVVPLSALHRFPRFTAPSFAENMSAMLLFGVIVAFFARGASAR
jgi:uncharacterized membrane protein YagU involved in acid resistance